MTRCQPGCVCANPVRHPPTANQQSFTTRETSARRDELHAGTHDTITGLDQLQAQDVLRWIADRDLDTVREALNEEGLS